MHYVRHCGRAMFCAFALLQISFAHATLGQPGTLDPSWNGTGRVITPVGGFDDLASAMAVQPDGKVIVAGRCQTDDFPGFCAVRYLANGTLDSSWNSGGAVITVFDADQSANAYAVALQVDGKVLLAGQCNSVAAGYKFCALRYLSDGTLDTGWNGSGMVATTIGTGMSTASAMAVQPDGKVLVAGSCMNNATQVFCTIRYNSDGSLDSGWNGNGMVLTAMGSGSGTAKAVAVQADGKVLVAGSCTGAVNEDFCSVRYSAGGVLDSSWGTVGKVVTSIGSGADLANAMLLQPDGKVLLAGTCSNGSNTDFCALRYQTNGTPDPSWNGSGIVMTAMGSGNDDAVAIALQPDGKVLLAGTCLMSNNELCALRYHASGTVDTSWNGSGKASTSIGPGSDVGTAMALQSDGKVLLAGFCRVTGPLSYDFCALRYDGGPFPAACSLDIDGDSQVLATTDALIHARIALGITGDAVINGISFSVNAKRNTWALIRAHLSSWCGMALP